MSMTKTDDYQYPLAKVKRFTFADLVNGDSVAAHSIFPSAIVIAGAVVVVTAWDSGTSAVLEVGDINDLDRYTSSAIDLASAGRTALTLTGHKHTAMTDLLLTLTEVGTAATEGEAYLEFQIIMEDRTNE